MEPKLNALGRINSRRTFFTQQTPSVMKQLPSNFPPNKNIIPQRKFQAKKKRKLDITLEQNSP
jgi:hypothetical protein